MAATSANGDANVSSPATCVRNWKDEKQTDGILAQTEDHGGGDLWEAQRAIPMSPSSSASSAEYYDIQALDSLQVSDDGAENPGVSARTDANTLRVSDREDIKALSAKLTSQGSGSYKCSAKLAEELHSAIDRKDEEAVFRLLQQERVHPNIQRSGFNLQPLHRALSANAAQIAIYLILAGAELGTSGGKGGETALIRAVKGGLPDEVIALLCERGAAVNAIDSCGQSALHHAATQDPKDDTIKILCRYEAELEPKDNTGATPLHCAVANGGTRSAGLLIEQGADLEARAMSGLTPLLMATSMQYSELVELLSGSGADVNYEMGNSTPLLHAINASCTDIAALIIKAGADVNKPPVEGDVALLLAVKKGNTKITELIVSHGATVSVADASGNTALHIASKANSLEIAELLLDAGVPVDVSNKDTATPLSLAVFAAQVDMTQLLLSKGANANHAAGPSSPCLLWHAITRLDRSLRRDQTDHRPQYRSSTAAHTKIIRMLLSAGASPTRGHGPHGMTPLHLAAKLGLDATVEAMLSRPGVDADARTLAGHTPLFSAAEGRRLPTVRLLLDRGRADVRARTAAGETLLFAAARDADLLLFLLEMRDGPADCEAGSVHVPNRSHYEASSLRVAAMGRLRALARRSLGSLRAGGGGGGVGSTGSPRRISVKSGGPGRPVFEVNHRSEHGATALHVAAMSGHLDAVRALLQHGAHQFLATEVYESLDDYRERRGYRQGTPAGLARQRGHDKVAEMIEGWRYR